MSRINILTPKSLLIAGAILLNAAFIWSGIHAYNADLKGTGGEPTMANNLLALIGAAFILSGGLAAIFSRESDTLKSFNKKPVFIRTIFALIAVGVAILGRVTNQIWLYSAAVAIVFVGLAFVGQHSKRK